MNEGFYLDETFKFVDHKTTLLKIKFYNAISGIWLA